MSKQEQHWDKTRNLLFITLAIWFVFSIGIFLFGAEMEASSFRPLGYPLSYYMTCQGSLGIFVILIFWFAGRQEKIDEVIFEKLKDRADEISDVYRELKKDVEMSEKRLLIEIKSLKNDIGARVGVLERYKWLILGGAIVIGWVLSKNLIPIMHMMNGA